MKKQFLAVFFLLIFLLSCAGCSAEPSTEEVPLPTESATVPAETPKPTPEPAPESADVSVSAISEHTLKSPLVESFMIDQQWPYIIAEYKKNCTPLTLDENGWMNVTLDLDITDRNIIYICPLDDPYGETTSYIDLFVESKYDPSTKTLKIDGNQLTNNGVNLYSFLIWATDESGNEFYYYTRVAT